MDDNEITTKELGLAESVSMDDFIRTLIAQMFENDNDVATLKVQLQGTADATPPEVEIELNLVSINGVPTRTDDE